MQRGPGPPTALHRHNRRQIAKVEALEHKSRRQDVLVDDELIYAFYDQHLPADVYSGADLARVVACGRQAADDKLLQLSPDELMRHEAAGVTTRPSPRSCAWVVWTAPPLPARARRCARRHHRDRAAVCAQPGERGARRMAGARHAGTRSGPAQEPAPKPCARLTPLPDFVAEFIRLTPFGKGGLTDALLKQPCANGRAGRAAQRTSSWSNLQPHLFMNFRVVDEHTPAGPGRQLAALRPSWAAAVFQPLPP